MQNPDEMPHDAAFHMGLHCLPKYLFGPQRVKYDGSLFVLRVSALNMHILTFSTSEVFSVVPLRGRA